ncbi:hypothetical protein BJY00DRAFT_310556 [Aspergillus carlsbadensis]|nr:hypothetical protein BJY00DRAFT_310556 [Aspergillus carlsbadensis]
MAADSRSSAHEPNRIDGIAMPTAIRPARIIFLDSVLDFDPVPTEKLEGAMIGPVPNTPTPAPSTFHTVDGVTSASGDVEVGLDSESPVIVPRMDGTALSNDSAPGPALASRAATFRLNPQVAAFVPQATTTSLPTSSGTRRMANLDPEAPTFSPIDGDAAHTDCSCCDGSYPGTVQFLVQGILPAIPPPGDELDFTPPPQTQHSITIGVPYAGGHNIPTAPLHTPTDFEVRCCSTLVAHTMALLHARGLNWVRVQACIRTPLNDPTSWAGPTILITMGLLDVDREAFITAFREILLFAEQELEIPPINVEAVDTLYAPAAGNHENDNSDNSDNNDNNDKDGDFILPNFAQFLLAEMDRLANMDLYLPPHHVWVKTSCASRTFQFKLTSVSGPPRLAR